MWLVRMGAAGNRPSRRKGERADGVWEEEGRPRAWAGEEEEVVVALKKWGCVCGDESC